ncbi:hypothetical protein [Methylogaea oryzae]|uniref:Glycine zipper domain-containing protein n=1 Tax=Methylogaea oryzae TaxID=1295382 RepID=A0A8D4VRT5_9GAMM|nr:hypothetical protein [Methylogaea oryzae]BBL72681.1 hypothetical protein MoryE10_32870 [Methylogaea oryzae]
MATMKKTAVTMVLCTSLVATGCATTQEGQQMQGAALGALAGGLTTGLLTGNVGYGIAAAVGGAALGWGAVKLVQAATTQQVRTAEQDQQLYGFTPSANAVLVKMNKATATPEKLAAGQSVVISSDYSLSLPQGTANSDVVESYSLKKDGQVLTSSEPTHSQKAAGGYAVNATIAIPKSAKPGTYVVETKVQSGTSYDVSQAVFVVGN